MLSSYFVDLIHPGTKINAAFHMNGFVFRPPCPVYLVIGVYVRATFYASLYKIHNLNTYRVCRVCVCMFHLRNCLLNFVVLGFGAIYTRTYQPTSRQARCQNPHHHNNNNNNHRRENLKSHILNGFRLNTVFWIA